MRLSGSGRQGCLETEPARGVGHADAAGGLHLEAGYIWAKLIGP